MMDILYIFWVFLVPGLCPGMHFQTLRVLTPKRFLVPQTMRCAPPPKPCFFNTYPSHTSLFLILEIKRANEIIPFFARREYATNRLRNDLNMLLNRLIKGLNKLALKKSLLGILQLQFTNNCPAPTKHSSPVLVRVHRNFHARLHVADKHRF